ncbi:hypothetical protein C0992_012279 [Termitomyces sp. T32_za158]|nr:hypothetical protein C0992_012279 [Termitomyces sp. T32_za158]
MYKLADQLAEAEEKDLPATPGGEFLIFAASMRNIPVPFYNNNQVNEAKYKILLTYRVLDVYLYMSGPRNIKVCAAALQLIVVH